MARDCSSAVSPSVAKRAAHSAERLIGSSRQMGGLRFTTWKAVAVGERGQWLMNPTDCQQPHRKKPFTIAVLTPHARTFTALDIVVGVVKEKMKTTVTRAISSRRYLVGRKMAGTNDRDRREVRVRPINQAVLCF